MNNQTLEEVQKAMVMAKAEELRKLLGYSGFGTKEMEWCDASKSVCMDMKDFFDGVWQTGVEITKVDFYVYRILVEPLLDESYQPDNDITIDFVASYPTNVIGYFTRVWSIKGSS